MSDIRPFRAVRPAPDRAHLVASPPYDVLDTEEARTMAAGNPLSFLHICKPEIDLPASVDHYADAVYAQGRENLRRFQQEGVLSQEEKPCFYLYEQSMRIGSRIHTQIGLVAGASVAEYESGLIKKHELTRADKEADRVRHVDELDANDEPVFLAYRQDAAIDAIVARLSSSAPLYDFTAADGIGHRVWVVRDDATIAQLAADFWPEDETADDINGYITQQRRDDRLKDL